MTTGGEQHDDPKARQALLEALRWQLDIGADEALEDEPQDHYAVSQAQLQQKVTKANLAAAAQPRATPPQAPASTGAAQPLPSPQGGSGEALFEPKVSNLRSIEATLSEARQLAAGAKDLAALRAAVESFEGCALKKTAMNCVFADGAAGAPLMILGEAPGANEDRQ